LIKAAIAEDFFYLWSFPYEQARNLVVSGVSPVLFEGRAWLSVAAVRLRTLRWMALPIMNRASVVGLTLLCEYRDHRCDPRRGNFFLRMSSDSLLVAVAARAMCRDYGEWSRIELSPDGKLETPRLSLGLAEPVSPGDAARLAALFHENCSGIVRGGKRAFYSSLGKDHWNMRPRRLVAERFCWLDGLDLRPEFGFDCSTNQGSWAPLRPVLV
jgi:hypothetical protein